jgi:hypothetical protein
MTCSAFRDRLYDEDGRAALQAGTALPSDLERHLAGCGVCRRASAEAAADLVTLRHALRVGPPPHLRVRLLRDADVALTLPDPPTLDWRQAASWAAAGGAVAAAAATVLMAAPLLWQVGVFVLAGSVTAGARVVVTPLTRPIPRA